MPAESEEQVERERRKRVEGAARVVADEHHIAQIESSQEVEHNSCDTPRRQIGVRLHRNGMGCQRPRRGDRAKATPAQSLRHIGPQRVVDEESVDEHDWSPVVWARDPVMDRAGVEVDGPAFGDLWPRQGIPSAPAAGRRGGSA
jgi:hypothetical protein